MSAIVYSQPNKAYPQPDFEARRDTDNAQWTGSQTFRIRKGTLAQITSSGFFAQGRQATLLDPALDSIWSFLRIRSADVQNSVGGWQDVIVHYGGIPSTDGNGNPVDDASEHQVTFSMRGVTGDIPLQDHPKWKELDADERNALGKIASGEYGYGPNVFDDSPSPGFATYKAGSYEPGEGLSFLITPDPISSDNAVQFARLIAEGVTTYKGAGFTWSKRWNSTEPITNAQLNRLGKTVAAPPGPPPQPAGDRDWLLTYANIEQQGEIDANPTYVNELVFELSEEGKWNEFLQG
jgi:hypothetical protein